VFRAGTTFVQVDAYPTKDGRIVEGLGAADFKVFEDGRPQEIDSVEFVRIEPNTPDAERRDPNSQAEANALAADPRNRVFVVYLDHYHVTVDGSYRTRRPLVDMLNRLLAPNDLFGVMTPVMRPTDLVLGRRTLTIEEQLSRHWIWGEERPAGQDKFLDPKEMELAMCTGGTLPPEIAGRMREERVLQSLEGLMSHLGRIREARKSVLLFTRGWTLYRRNDRAANRGQGSQVPAIPRIGTDPFGRLSTAPADGYADRASCNAEIQRLYMLDNFEHFRELMAAANRNNVTFYPVNPGGLEAPIGAAEMDRVRDREDSMRTIAANTDGITIISNDLAAGLRRIADDVSAYYVLGYYSTNPTADGKYRKIEVKMNPPGVRVTARRGYLAPTEAAVAAANASAAPAAPSPASALTVALGELSRLRPNADLFTHVVVRPREIVVSVELASALMVAGQWTSGADLNVTVADAGGTAVGSATGRLEPGSRGLAVPVARPAEAQGPFRVSVRVSNGAAAPLTDITEAGSPASSLLTGPLLFRATPSPRSPLRAAADFQFRRTERVHVQWVVAGGQAIDSREARLLGRDGKPLAVPVTVSDRDTDGRREIVADLNLAPLTTGDYVIELTAARGSDRDVQMVPLRVIR